MRRSSTAPDCTAKRHKSERTTSEAILAILRWLFVVYQHPQYSTVIALQDEQ